MNNLKRAIDADLSRLRVTQRERDELLQNAWEGKKVKKKLSAAFVLALVLVLMGAVALAVATIQGTGRLIAQVEKENGDYSDWPVEKRAQIVLELMDEGSIPQTEERERLREGTLDAGETARVADEAIAQLTGEDAAHASFLGIMNAVWGPFEGWTREQQAWYSEVMKDVGFETQGKSFYVLPTGPMDEAGALACAKREILRVFDTLDADTLDQFDTMVDFQIPEDAEPGDTKAYWYVCFDSWNTGIDTSELPFAMIDLFIDPDTGMPRDSLEEAKRRREEQAARRNHPIRQQIQALQAECGEDKSLPTWSLESKARWSAEIAPLILAFERENPEEMERMFAPDERAASRFIYGLPDEKALSQTNALARAQDALRAAYPLTDEEWALLFDRANVEKIYICYDVTNPDAPLWKFVFTMPTEYNANDDLAARAKALYGDRDRDSYDLIYRVELNAYTGQAVRTLSLNAIDVTEEAYRELL